MFLRGAIAISALLGFTVVSMPVSAMTGIGCPDLPLYYRAVGTIENGPGSCNEPGPGTSGCGHLGSRGRLEVR